MRTGTGVLGAMILYQPEPELLNRALDAALEQVENLVLVDNGGSQAEPVIAEVAQRSGVVLIRNASNVGVSRALNQVLDAARERDAQQLLLLDQDSLCPGGLVERLQSSLAGDVAVACPVVRDRHLEAGGAPAPPRADAKAPTDVNYCITAGAMYSVEACLAVGGWDEDLFVDFVDFDFCLRLRLAGYRIVHRHDAVVDHAVGRRSQHHRWIADNHSSSRCFHIAADMVRYSWKHRGRPRELLADGRGVLGTYGYLVHKAAVVLAFEDDRARKVAALLRGMTVGTVEALRGRPAPSAPRPHRLGRRQVTRP